MIAQRLSPRMPKTATDKAEYTGQSCSLRKGSHAGGPKEVFFFRSTLIYQEGEGQPHGRTRQDGLWPAFAPAVVLFIALPEVNG